MMENNFVRNCYPRLARIKRNDYYLGIVQDLYCGKEGEMPNFLQFTYQANILLPFGNDFARLFGMIATEELLHCQLLAETIISLGGDPVLCDNQGRWLGGRWLDYVKDVKQMLTLNIETKQKNIIDYKTAASKIDDMAVKQMLVAITKDEENILQKLKDALKQIS
jgi:bacterioferritin (cytochrome b1)